MNKIKLKKGDKILVDFDDTIVELDYPRIGKIKKGMRKFLNNCRKNKVEVYIWTARCNNHTGKPKDYKIFGSKAINQVRKFMIKNKLYFSDIVIMNKPLGKHFCSYMLDDSCRHSAKYFIFEK